MFDYTPTQIALFWSKVHIPDDDPNSCWRWKCGKSRGNYGRFWVNGRKCYAHRISYTLANGTFPEELRVLHSCDNPPCVNPSHLFLGTQSDNVRDCIEKDRRNSLKGEQHPRCKLSDVDIDLIRLTYQQGASQTELGHRFGVSQAQIWRIVNRLSR